MVSVALTGRKLEKYLDAIVRAGADAIVFDANNDPETVLERVDALILGGGPDVDPAIYRQDRHLTTYGVDRQVDDFEIALLAGALVREMPVLAICRGIQVVNVAYGGTLHQHIVDDPGVAPHGKPGEVGEREEREIAVTEGSLLASVMGTTQVTGSCHHHQSIDQVGAGLRVTARAADGIVEGVQLDTAWLLAVQWHPEDTAGEDAAQQALFDALVTRTQLAP